MDILLKGNPHEVPDRNVFFYFLLDFSNEGVGDEFMPWRVQIFLQQILTSIKIAWAGWGNVLQTNETQIFTYFFQILQSYQIVFHFFNDFACQHKNLLFVITAPFLFLVSSFQEEAHFCVGVEFVHFH